MRACGRFGWSRTGGGPQRQYKGRQKASPRVSSVFMLSRHGEGALPRSGQAREHCTIAAFAASQEVLRMNQLLKSLVPNLLTKLRIFSLCMVCAAVGSASTIRIPADQPTIQAGIDAAQAGDVVLVSPGTYAE